MKFSRRAIVIDSILSFAVAATFGFAGRASAGTDYFQYDGQGRVVGVFYADGSSVTYTYDAVGNRIQLTQAAATPSSGYVATIPIIGQVPVNLRDLATRHGYDGAHNATITFVVGNGITITGLGGTATSAGGNPGTLAVDTGTWPSGYTINLTLTVQSGGTIRGGGGAGGQGDKGDGFGPGSGGNGGDAVYCRLPMAINVNSGGKIQGGGSGGSGGAYAWAYPDLNVLGGGGGGGGAPNGAAGGGGPAEVPGSPGTAGTTSGGGAGGAGANLDGYYASDGQGGGNYGDSIGGSGGYAIRKNGHSVTVSNSGTITGTVG